METDEQLLLRSRDEPSAFELLVERHGSAVHAFLARRAPRAADDLLAEAWLAAFAGRATFDPARGGARGWLFGIARNVLLAYYRRRSVRPAPAGMVDSVADEWSAVDERLDAVAATPALKAALSALPPPERELLLLIAWEQLTPSEAAQVLGIPPGTARSRLHRARDSIRERLIAADQVVGDNSTAAEGGLS